MSRRDKKGHIDELHRLIGRRQDAMTKRHVDGSSSRPMKADLVILILGRLEHIPSLHQWNANEAECQKVEFPR